MIQKLKIREKKQSLKYSMLDGISASGMIGFTNEFFSPFLLLLGGTTFQVGILSSLPSFMASIVQILSPEIVDRLKSRKKIILIFVFFQLLMIIPIIGISIYGKCNPYFFILCVIFFTAFGAIATPAWASLMSNLVPDSKRGVFFGNRTRIIGLTLVFFTFIAGFIVHFMNTINIYYGFTIIFFGALIFRIFSWFFLSKMKEQIIEHKQEHHFTIVQFWAQLKKSNFAKFVLFMSTLHFSVFLASPFFTVLMLKDYKFNYSIYTIVTVSCTLAANLMIAKWGKISDSIGNIKIIKIIAPLISVLPVLWLVSSNWIYLIFVQIAAGVLWAGLNLCALNFVYDAVTPQKRTRCIAYFNSFNGLGICLGSLIGGVILEKLPSFLGHKIYSLFTISTIFRLLISLTLTKFFNEVKPVEKISYFKLFLRLINIK